MGELGGNPYSNILFIIFVIGFTLFGCWFLNNNYKNSREDMLKSSYNIITPTSPFKSRKCEGEMKKIPRVVYQTNSDIVTSGLMYRGMETWRKMNPGYSYHIFNEYKSREYMRNNMDKKIIDAYDAIKSGKCKSELFVYCLLYIEGGIYVDNNMECIESISKYIKDIDYMGLIDYNSNGKYLCNKIIAAKAGNEFIKTAIDLVVENVEKGNYGDEMDEDVSARLLSMAVKKCTNKEMGYLFKEGVNEENSYRYRLLSYAVSSERDKTGGVGGGKNIKCGGVKVIRELKNKEVKL